MFAFIDLSSLLTSPDSRRTLILVAAGGLALFSQRKRIGGAIGSLVSRVAKVVTNRPVVAKPDTSENDGWEDRIEAYRLICECLERDGKSDIIAQLDKDVLPCLVRDDDRKDNSVSTTKKE